MESTTGIVKKGVYFAGISIFLLVLSLKQKEALDLGKFVFNTLVVSCRIENAHDKYESIFLNGTFLGSAKRVFHVVNSWYPETSTDKMNFKDLCNSWEQPIDLLIYITSGTTQKSAERRQLARTTWLNVPSHHGNVRHMFVLGLSTNAYENQRVLNEAVRFWRYTHFEFYGFVQKSDTEDNVSNEVDCAEL